MFGSGEVLPDNASQSVVPLIVDGPAPERTICQMWSVEQSMGAFVGPPLAGLLIAMALSAPFVLDVACVGLAAWLVAPGEPGFGRAAGPAPALRRIWRDPRGGLGLRRPASSAGAMSEVTINGITLQVPATIRTAPMMERLRAGTYEEAEARAAIRRAKPGLRVLELGAGLGYVSALCARGAGADNLLSVEANPVMAPIARANLARNGFGAAQVLHAAVSGRGAAGSVAFTAAGSFLGGSVAGDGDTAGTVTVPRIAVGDLLARHRPNLVIMDVEGAEAEMFDAPWPASLRFLVLELHPRRYDRGVIKRIVDCMGRSGLTYDPATSRGRVLGFMRVCPGAEGG